MIKHHVFIGTLLPFGLAGPHRASRVLTVNNFSPALDSVSGHVCQIMAIITIIIDIGHPQ